MRRQAGQSRDRQEDDRAHRADHAWRVDERGFDDAKADVEAKLSRQALTVDCHGDSGSERGKSQPASERRASESRQEKRTPLNHTHTTIGSQRSTVEAVRAAVAADSDAVWRRAVGSAGEELADVDTVGEALPPTRWSGPLSRRLQP